MPYSGSFGGQGKKFHFPIYGGFTFTTHKTLNQGSISNSIGLGYGFGFEYRILSNFRLGFDVLYLSKSYEENLNGVNRKVSLSLLEFPVKLKYMPIPQLHFFAGPYLLSFVQSATLQSQGSAASVKGQFTNDYGLTFGTWVGFQATPVLCVGLDLRYDLGLANVQDKNDPSFVIRTRTIIALFTLTLGF